MTKKLLEVLEHCINLIFPKSLYCVCCGNLIDESRSYSLCDHCMEHFRWNKEKYEYRNEIKLISCVKYGIYERSLVFDLKYKNRKYIARVIAEIIADKLNAYNFIFDYIVPVPLHRKKLDKRGYNQAALICNFLAPLIGAEYVDCLERIKRTRPMRGLNYDQRAGNVAGSFALKKDYENFAKGKRIAILDDFFTTGATARECIKSIKAANAYEITFVVFASR